MQHPSQGVDHRAELSAAQHPFAVIFGCSDSRVAAEIIFDQGLGDVFVVRTAGHVLDTTVIGSIEYGVDVLGASLVVVLGHDSCGAVAAATTALTTGELPTGFVRAIVDRVIPSIVNLGGGGPGALSSLDPAVLGHEHVQHTVRMLQGYSRSLAESVAEGRGGDRRPGVHARRRHGPPDGGRRRGLSPGRAPVPGARCSRPPHVVGPAAARRARRRARSDARASTSSRPPAARAARPRPGPGAAAPDRPSAPRSGP